MKQNIKISIIIPAYNRPKLLERAIQSVLNQTFQDFEIIVVDDGIEKRANQIIEKIDDNRIIYIQHQKNRGASVARNTGIKNAQGKYITFLDDDDKYLSEKLEKQFQIMEKYSKQIDFTYCLAEVYSQQSGDFIYVQKHNFKQGIHNFFEDALSMKTAVATPTIFCKKKTVLEIGGFDDKFPNAEDKDFFIRLSKKSKGYFLNKPLVKVNFSDKKSNRLSGNLKFRIKGREELLKKYQSELSKRPKILTKHLFMLALLYQKDENFKKAYKFFMQSWYLNKCSFRFPKRILENLYLRFFQKTFKKKSK